MRGRVVWLCGPPATGKSYLGSQLSEGLSLPFLGIDRERARLTPPGRWWPVNDGLAWQRLGIAMAQAGDCIVETCGTSGKELRLFVGWRVFSLLCVADRATRLERLTKRVAEGYRLSRNNPTYVASVLRIPYPPGKPDALWNSGNGEPKGEDLEAILEKVRVFLR